MDRPTQKPITSTQNPFLLLSSFLFFFLFFYPFTPHPPTPYAVMTKHQRTVYIEPVCDEGQLRALLGGVDEELGTANTSTPAAPLIESITLYGESPARHGFVVFRDVSSVETVLKRFPWEPSKIAENTEKVSDTRENAVEIAQMGGKPEGASELLETPKPISRGESEGEMTEQSDRSGKICREEANETTTASSTLHTMPPIAENEEKPNAVENNNLSGAAAPTSLREALHARLARYQSTAPRPRCLLHKEWSRRTEIFKKQVLAPPKPPPPPPSATRRSVVYITSHAPSHQDSVVLFAEKLTMLGHKLQGVVKMTPARCSSGRLTVGVTFSGAVEAKEGCTVLCEEGGVLCLRGIGGRAEDLLEVLHRAEVTEALCEKGTSHEIPDGCVVHDAVQKGGEGSEQLLILTTVSPAAPKKDLAEQRGRPKGFQKAKKKRGKEEEEEEEENENGADSGWGNPRKRRRGGGGGRWWEGAADTVDAQLMEQLGM